jgi:hypothetical protein
MPLDRLVKRLGVDVGAVRELGNRNVGFVKKRSKRLTIDYKFLCSSFHP